jgi:hypothetical protein
MIIGLFGINFGVAGGVDAMIEIAKAAEASGIESVWTGEHVVLPDPRVAPSPSILKLRFSILPSRSVTSRRTPRGSALGRV